MSEVHSLFGGPVGERRPDADTVDVLEDLLERAKSGEVVGIAAVAVNADGTAGHWLAGFVTTFSAIGALSVLKHQLLDYEVDDG